MNYSNNLNESISRAQCCADGMNSTKIGVPHLLLAAMQLEKVKGAVLIAGVNVEQLIHELTEECKTIPQLSDAQIKAYATKKIQRHINRDMPAEQMLGKAHEIGSSSDWNTGSIEISHVMMAAAITGHSKAFNKHMKCSSRRKTSDVLDNFMNALIKVEASEHNIKPREITVVLNRNGSKGSDDEFNSGVDVKREEMKISPFCTDMLYEAATNNKPLIGRDQEIANALQCLSRRDKPNCILVGPPGVGKTEIVRGLAKKIVAGNVPEHLKKIQLFSVDIPAMLAGAMYRGDFEKRLKELLESVIHSKHTIVLFIDEIHTVLGAGKTVDSTMDAANILKPYLTEGKLRVIGATTDDEYRRYVERDPAFMRRFQSVPVMEPSAEDAIAIIDGVRPTYEKFHDVKIDHDIIKASVELSVRHMHDRYLPDKAIDIIDQSCARVKMAGKKEVYMEDVCAVVSELCKIPVQSLQTTKKDEMAKIRALSPALKAQVFGQDEAIDSVVQVVRNAKAGLSDENKPIGSFLFVGPSGVGKTEIAKQLAMNLGNAFIRFDMSEYAEPHAIAKLIGSPPGYVGHEDGGLLVEQVRNKPNSVILFDEIEKAHPDIYKIFLQILDYGMLTDSKGRKADFRNAVIIMTSNAGSTSVQTVHLGFERNRLDSVSTSASKAINALMPNELRGRISKTIVFNHLSDDVAKMIVKKELGLLIARAKKMGVDVEYTDEVVDKIAKIGISTQYGAREIQKVIEREITTQLSKLLVSELLVSEYDSNKCMVAVEDDKFILKTPCIA